MLYQLKKNYRIKQRKYHIWLRSLYLLLVLTGVLVAQVEALAAIGFDAASSTKDSQTNSLSWTHTVTTSGSNRILVVGISWRNSSADTATVNTVTYNSQSLDEIRKDTEFTNNENRSTALYYLKDPPTGSAYTILVSFTSGNYWHAVGGAVSLTGVDISGDPVNDHNGLKGNSATPSVTLTTTTDGAWVVDTLVVRNIDSGSASSNQDDERWNVKTSGGANNTLGAGSTEGPKTPAGDVTMSWSLSSSQKWSISAAAFKPAAWYHIDWQYRKKLTLDKSLVAADLTDFPIALHLATSTFDYDNTNTDGSDIRLTDKDGNLLKYEIEYWGGDGTTSTVWVKLPTVYANASTTFYIYWGNYLFS